MCTFACVFVGFHVWMARWMCVCMHALVYVDAQAPECHSMNIPSSKPGGVLQLVDPLPRKAFVIRTSKICRVVRKVPFSKGVAGEYTTAV